MTYQVATDMSARLAAAAPQFGSFQKGFLQGPTSAIPLIDIHGTKDTTVPANTSLSGDGYYYTTVADIFSVWGKANGCSGSTSHYTTPYDGQNSLYCVNHGTCSGGDLVRCSWNGGHNWFGNSAAKNGGLVTYFLFQWAETSHLGFGNKAEGDFLEDFRVLDADEERQTENANSDLTLQFAAEGHYGNPAKGCADDEDVLTVGEGSACAPKIASQNKTEVGIDGVTVPVPACKIGGVSPQENGCPIDVPVPKHSKAFPVCLAKGLTEDPYTMGEFHCLLACPCPDVENDSCGAVAGSHCPAGATCQLGELRARGMGVCSYASDVLAIV